MSAMDRVQLGSMAGTAAELAAEAERAEAAGFDGVWAPELYRSTITQATWLAAKTERMAVGTGIAWAFTRSPFVLAISALDIDEISGGRFRLGLGAGVKRLNQTWHNAEYGKPAPHLREAIEAVRLITEKAHTGEPIRFEGSYYDLDIKGWARPGKPVRARIPIYTAALREGMARMAGDVADGLVGHPICSVRWLDEIVVPSFEEGLRRSGRARSEFDYLPTICAAIDDDKERALDAARRTLAFYAAVKTYRPCWEMHGFGENAVACGEAFRKGDLEAVARAITDEMVETYCATGTIDEVRPRVEQVAERGDGIWLGPPTYFIADEQIAEYQQRLIDEFGPDA